MSVGIDYSCVNPHDLRSLVEWCLRQYGDKSEESRYKHEKLAIDLMEIILGKRAQRDRTPEWLITSNRGSQRLDGYWKAHGIAVEYHGVQHYKVVPHFHRNGKASLERQSDMDQKKRDACAKAGVTLIEIPYHVNLTEPDILEHINRNNDWKLKMNSLKCGLTTG